MIPKLPNGVQREWYCPHCASAVPPSEVLGSMDEEANTHRNCGNYVLLRDVGSPTTAADKFNREFRGHMKDVENMLLKGSVTKEDIDDHKVVEQLAVLFATVPSAAAYVRALSANLRLYGSREDLTDLSELFAVIEELCLQLDRLETATKQVKSPAPPPSMTMCPLCHIEVLPINPSYNQCPLCKSQYLKPKGG